MDPYTFGGANRMLATFVPDEIIFNAETLEPGKLKGVLFFADVSGFTDLCERYYAIRNKGRAKFTDVLNSYIECLVNEIIRYKGDVLKFSGDAFLALWKSHSYITMEQSMQAATDCALAIQKTYGQFKTDMGNILRVKIVISAGSMVFSVIGGSNFMILGKPIWEVKEAGDICKPGNVIVTSSAQPYLQLQQYKTKILPENYVLVKDFAVEWKGRCYLSSYDIYDDRRFSYFEEYMMRKMVTEEFKNEVRLTIHQNSGHVHLFADFDNDQQLLGKCFDSAEDICLHLSNASEDNEVLSPGTKCYVIDEVINGKDKYNIVLRLVNEDNDGERKNNSFEFYEQKNRKISEDSNVRRRNTQRRSRVNSDIIRDIILRPISAVHMEEENNLQETQRRTQYHFTFTSEKNDQSDVLNCRRYIFVTSPLLPYTRKNCEERISLLYATKYNMQIYLNKFIINPVVNVVHENIPVEYLTEMRQVITVLVNLVLTKRNSKQILAIIDGAYRLICSVVRKENGCVNKVSIFDKDLMFLIIFGLRGYTHILEAQSALICADEIKIHLSKHSGLSATSVAVAAGVNYTGVVGCERRREFTVIGRSVNKAARLVYAYPNIICCDRQIMLNSKLRVDNFSILPYIELKGFKKSEPIYEFRINPNVAKTAEPFPRIEKYALLGREKEMTLYSEYIKAAQVSYTHRNPFELKEETFIEDELIEYENENGINIFIIKGESCQGRTRLITEMLYDTPSDTTVITFTPTLKDKQKPFKTVRYLMNVWLNLSETNNIEERTDKIREHFSLCLQYLCALNDIIHVNFKVTSEYLELRNYKKDFIKLKLLTYLCQKNSNNLYAIFIDNSEYIDNESLPFLQTITKSKLAFLCMTVNIFCTPSNLFRKFLIECNTKNVTLNSIDVRFHAALICQLLNIRVVSFELVKYIQKCSEGNPGWISKFLTTLLDWNEIEIRNLDDSIISEQELVMPSIKLLYRNSDLHDEEIEATLNPKVKDICSNIYLFNKKRNILACIIPAEVSLKKLDIEDSGDLKLMQLYDSLPFEIDNLLKLAAYLGNEFHRTTLEFVLEDMLSEDIAEVVKFMFEARLIKCAKGQKELGYWQLKNELNDSEEDAELKCECKGYEIHELIHLPKYAYCSYMRFCQKKFRSMLYNFLTAEKVKSHATRLIPFIQLQITRCHSCGGGFFLRLNGRQFYDPLNQFSATEEKGKHSDVSVLSNYRRYKLFKSWSRFKAVKASGSKVIKYIRRTPARLDISCNIKTYEDHDFSNCVCISNLYETYQYVIDLFEEAEMFEEKINAILEFVQLNIRNNQQQKALQLLDYTTKLLNDEHILGVRDKLWKLTLINGRINTLKGQLYLEMGENVLARLFLNKALQIYNINFFTSQFLINWKTRFIHKKQKRLLNGRLGLAEKFQILLADQTSELMTNLFVLYLKDSKYNEANLAANWALNEALKSNSEFYTMCTAYTNVIFMNQYKRRKNFISRIEEAALFSCCQRETKLEVQEFRAVVKMYEEIFCRKFLNSDINEAIQFGLITFNLIPKLYGTNFRWPLLPLLVKSLIMAGKIIQAGELIRCQSDTWIQGDDIATKIYFTMCMDFNLDTGYSIVPFDVCENILDEKNLVPPLDIIDFKYRILYWLWYIRNQKFELAKKLFKYVNSVLSKGCQQDRMIIITYLRILEGLLILFVKSSDDRDYIHQEFIISNIYKLFNIIQKLTNTARCFTARYFHLKSYWNVVIGRKVCANYFLYKSKRITKKYSITYEFNWIVHNEKHWKGLTSEQINPWLRATELEDFNITQDDNLKIPYFTLTLPK